MCDPRVISGANQEYLGHLMTVHTDEKDPLPWDGDEYGDCKLLLWRIHRVIRRSGNMVGGKGAWMGGISTGVVGGGDMLPAGGQHRHAEVFPT